MKLIRLALKPETAAPVLTLAFASGVCMTLILARIVYTGDVRYAFLIWNLFLAWLPLAFALQAAERYHIVSGRNWRFPGLAGAWLLFFPNAPYIFTDLIHLTRGYAPHFWVDMVLILSCALTGLILGFLSLFLMQRVVRRMLGWSASWLFVAMVAAVSGFAICLGRFQRFNSWDVVAKPFALSRSIVRWAVEPLAHPSAIALPALFAIFLFIAYVLLYALTFLPRMQQAPTD